VNGFRVSTLCKKQIRKGQATATLLAYWSVPPARVVPCMNNIELFKILRRENWGTKE